MKQLSLRFKLYALVISLLLVLGISIVLTAQLSLDSMEEKLTNVQNTLAEIEYSEQVDWTGRLNE